MTRCCLIAVSVLVASCQSQDPSTGIGSATLSGTNSFSVHSAVSASVDGGTSASGFWLIDTNTNCEDVKKRGFVPFVVSALVGVVDSTTDDALLPGDVPVDGTQALYLDGGSRGAVGRMSFKRQDGTFDDATLGTVSYQEANAEHIKGHFSVTFIPDGGTLDGGGTYSITGDFDAPLCPGFEFK
jgi:hypothetical protein